VQAIIMSIAHEGSVWFAARFSVEDRQPDLTSRAIERQLASPTCYRRLRRGPRAFFRWIVGLVTATTMVLPFAFDGAPGQDLRGSDQYGDWPMHRQPDLQRAVPDGRRCRAILAAALVADQLVVRTNGAD
jgi:hypothetical protein